jgi:deoxyribonuclease V
MNPLPNGAVSLLHKNEQVGWTLRSKGNVSPVFVSPGNNMSIDDSLNIMQECLGKYRIPEPTRLAYELVNRFRTGELAEGFVDYQII